MPFFPVLLKKAVDSKQNVILQVRIPLRHHGIRRKRVLFSASPSVWNGSVQASLTVEAAFGLPLFLFAMVILMMPMKLMNEQRKVQTALEAACENASGYCSILNNMDEKDGGSLSSAALDHLPPGVAEGIGSAGILLYADHKVREATERGRVKNLSLFRSKVLEDGETIDLVLDYELVLPYFVFRLKSVPMTARSSRRAWIGREGGRGEGEGGTGGEEDEIVYIGRNSTRYHRLKTCHYLYNDISAVPYDSIGLLRNSEGRKYRACSRCGKNAEPGSTVYVMPGGESYHTDRHCSSIIAYVQAVPLSEVEYLGPCSYCSQ